MNSNHDTRALVHIVSHFHGIGGGEAHAKALADALVAHGVGCRLWADHDSKWSTHFGAQPIRPFSGMFPRGGILVILGSYTELSAWLAYAKPCRIVLVVNDTRAKEAYACISLVTQMTGKVPECVFVSSRVRKTLAIPGRITPPLIDLDHFQPDCSTRDKEAAIVIGRHSRDATGKHHPGDPSIYQLAQWLGLRVRLMGATCIAAHLGSPPGRMELMPCGAESSRDFLRSLDIFFYRTDPGHPEASGRVVLEAMACGLAVVAHTGGGYTDWIESGEDGFLFNSQEEAASLISGLSENRSLRITLGNAARRKAEAIAGHEAVTKYIAWISRI